MLVLSDSDVLLTLRKLALEASFWSIVGGALRNIKPDKTAELRFSFSPRDKLLDRLMLTPENAFALLKVAW